MGDYSEPYFVPWKNRLIRILLRPVFRGVFRAVYRVRLEGLGNVPAAGPYLIAFNHISIVDPPFVLAFWPVPPEALGAAELWERAGQSTLVRLYGTIPVRRGEYDRRLLETMLAVLRSGRPLMIAPEGGRTRKPGMRRASPGIGFLVENARVPVVPVGVVGSTESLLQLALRGRRPRLEMKIGRPVQFETPDLSPITRKDARQHIADMVMVAIARLLPAEYWGVYTERLTRVAEAP